MGEEMKALIVSLKSYNIGMYLGKLIESKKNWRIA